MPTAFGGSLVALGPLLAADGLGLGVAAVSEPGQEPAGPAEAAAAAAMPPRRGLEFLAGRRAARRALRAVGLDCGEIPRRGRLPVFPPGRAASISHSAGIAVAVAAVPGRDLPVGCDLELRPLPREAARLVLCEDEESLLAGTRLQPGAGAVWPVTALFSAKEAAWKALTVMTARGCRRRGDAAAARAGVPGRPAGRPAGPACGGAGLRGDPSEGAPAGVPAGAGRVDLAQCRDRRRRGRCPRTGSAGRL
ncbi:hypothetical protein DJ64_00525 [Streptomyces griseorubens]|uniref:4'-phosphopantetheinyl transferase N-terminal domain-containing protein n=1 Tax=Streptomyces griseorubens TaxID=66897 RepID=A0ABR4TAI2_9ACTN|nr:hypothetical protein DJ64_00525 [Streptomyces griseorubens]